MTISFDEILRDLGYSSDVTRQRNFPKGIRRTFAPHFKYTLFGVQVACLLQKNKLNSHCIKYKVFSKRIGYLSGYFQ